MTGEELSRRLMATFVEELEEHARDLDRILRELGSAPPEAKPELYRAVFRSVHGLKGAARAVSVRELEALCHALEDRLADAREGNAAPAPQTLALVGSASTAFSNAAGLLRRGQSLVEHGELGTLLARIHAAPAAPAAKPPPPPAGPRPESPGAAAARPVPPPPAETAPQTVPGASVVRVAADELDALLVQSGELLVAKDRVAGRADALAGLREVVASFRSELRRAARDARRGTSNAPRSDAALATAEEAAGRVEKELDRVTADLTGDVRSLDAVARRLDDEVRRARLLSFRDACDGLERAVHELARTTGKRARLVVRGGELGVDRVIVQKLREPLLHLVRNALDHGIEPEAARVRARKPVEGTLTVSAAVRGTRLEVTVEDDGAGLDPERLRATARVRGLAVPVDDRELLRLVFLPGFTTATAVTQVSGRGVGLDAVGAAVEALHGTIDVDNTPGKGARFRLAVPMTLSTLRVVLLAVSGTSLAIPAESVERLARIRAADVVTADGNAMLRTAGAPIPLVSLAALLGLPVTPPRELSPAVVMHFGGVRVALRVDELVSEVEVLVKSLGPRLRGLTQTLGAAILASGQVALILNPAELVRRAEGVHPDDFSRARAEASGAAAKKKLLVVDDTLTTRTLLKSIFETAGYEVTTATDGEEALRLLEGRDFSALVTDVEMPRMDGFELTRRVRATPRIVDLPVVLVTGLSSELHRSKGLEAGANAYLEKSVFDQKVLLDTIRELA